jgi:hypothetical protein
LLTALLGVAINFATDLQTSWIAWVAVAAIALAGGVVAVLLGRRAADLPRTGGSTITSSTPQGTSSGAYGLVIRETERTNPDGSKTKTVDYFSEEVAIQVFRQRFEADDDD